MSKQNNRANERNDNAPSRCSARSARRRSLGTGVEKSGGAPPPRVGVRGDVDEVLLLEGLERPTVLRLKLRCRSSDGAFHAARRKQIDRLAMLRLQPHCRTRDGVPHCLRERCLASRRRGALALVRGAHARGRGALRRVRQALRVDQLAAETRRLLLRSAS